MMRGLISVDVLAYCADHTDVFGTGDGWIHCEEGVKLFIESVIASEEGYQSFYVVLHRPDILPGIRLGVMAVGPYTHKQRIEIPVKTMTVLFNYFLFLSPGRFQEAAV